MRNFEAKCVQIISSIGLWLMNKCAKDGWRCHFTSFIQQFYGNVNSIWKHLQFSINKQKIESSLNWNDGKYQELCTNLSILSATTMTAYKKFSKNNPASDLISVIVFFGMCVCVCMCVRAHCIVCCVLCIQFQLLCFGSSMKESLSKYLFWKRKHM